MLSSLSIVLRTASVALVVAYLTDVPLSECSDRGSRGFARERALKSGVFRLIDSVLRLVASHMARLPLNPQREALERKICAAGEFHGFGPNEVIALSIFSALGGLASGGYVWATTGGTFIPLACCILGPLLPTMQLSSLTKARHKSVERGLPSAIDLAALCMGAGLDFPGALDHVVENMPDASAPIRLELERILQELALGRTRQQALASFSVRVDTDSVKEFVASVIQAEEKGTPLSVVLSTQATALRGRRSVLAEEAAARAGVMLMLPMLMMMGSITLILVGPLIIDMLNGGLM